MGDEDSLLSGFFSFLFIPIRMSMYRRLCISGFAGVLSSLLLAQNPITPAGKFFADPSAHQWQQGGRVYVYGSRDESKFHYCSHGYDVLSSDDMNNWTMHAHTFASKGEGDEVSYSDDFLYAPDCIKKGETYYLYYCMSGRHAEGVATSALPEGPFTKGQVIEGVSEIDPSVFVDDDGQAYLFWGQWTAKAAKLNPNMKSIDLNSVQDNILTEKEHYFHEGIQIFKRNGIYYLVYAHIGRRGMPTCLGYAMSSSVMGPYEYKGVIIDNFGSDPRVWNNHGSLAEIDGKWYVFYHRATNGVDCMRKACVEPVTFNEDGTIDEVEMTTSGASGPLNPFELVEAEWACYLTGNVRIETDAAGNETLAEVEHWNTASYKYFDFTKSPRKVIMRVIPKHGGRISIYANTLSRPQLASINIPPGDGYTPVTLSVDIKSELKGLHPVYLRFSGAEDKTLFKVDWFRFE